jgi:hypothetical protein
MTNLELALYLVTIILAIVAIIFPITLSLKLYFKTENLLKTINDTVSTSSFKVNNIEYFLKDLLLKFIENSSASDKAKGEFKNYINTTDLKSFLDNYLKNRPITSNEAEKISRKLGELYSLR